MFWFDTNILWVIVLGVLPIIVITYAGILFSPVAAATCALLARRRGLSAKRYALMGGIYSVMFLAPSVYLIVRLLNRKPPIALVGFAYFVLLALWVAGPMTTATSFLWVGFHLSEVFGTNRMITAVTIGIAIAGNVAMLGFWLRWFRRVRILRKPAPYGDGLLPHMAYVLPFLLVPLGLLSSSSWPMSPNCSKRCCRRTLIIMEGRNPNPCERSRYSACCLRSSPVATEPRDFQRRIRQRWAKRGCTQFPKRSARAARRSRRKGLSMITVWGARVSLAYYPADNEFRGMVYNVTYSTVRDVIIEVRLSNGTELRPKPVKKLKNGDFVPIVLKASDEPFTSWTGSIRASE